MTQSNFGTIDPNTKSGTGLATDLNDWRDALHSMHSGSTRPAYAVAGTLWLDNASSSLWLVKIFDGVDDTIIAQIDVVNNVTRFPERRQEVVKTSDYTITSDDAYIAIVMNKTGAGVLSLPALSGTANELYLVKNISADDVVIDPNSAETIDGATSITLKQYDSVWIWVASGKANWRAAITGNNYVFNTVASALGFNFFTDCIPTWVSNTSLSFSAGYGLFSGKQHTLPAYTKTMSAWASGSGNGMLDTGAIGASKTYFLFAIRNTANGACDYLASLSLTPLVPAGWEVNSGARVGIALTNASSQLIKFKQRGNKVLLEVLTWFTSTADIAFALAIAPNMPIGLSVDASIVLAVQVGTTSADGVMFISDADAADATVVANPPQAVSCRARTGTGFPSASYNNGYARTNTAGQVGRSVSVSSASISCTAFTQGWIDYSCARIAA